MRGLQDNEKDKARNRERRRNVRDRKISIELHRTCTRGQNFQTGQRRGRGVKWGHFSSLRGKGARVNYL